MSDRDIYGSVTGAGSIKSINVKIRKNVKNARTRGRLKELLDRSRYLYTLTFSPTFKKAIRGSTAASRKAAKAQFTKTAEEANRVQKKLNMRGKKFKTTIG